MTSLAERRAFLTAFSKSGTIEGAIAATGTPAELHAEWLKDQQYNSAFRAITGELRKPPKPRAKAKPEKKRGRPRKRIDPPAIAETPAAAAIAADPEPAPGPPVEPAPPAAAPVVEERVYPSKAGYTKIYVREGQEVEPPEQPGTPRPAAEPDFEPSVEVTIASDADQRRLIDEYGELDRRMQLRAMDAQRYETLKRAIKSWFDQAPADADGTVEGDVYLLHLSARERERKIRSMRDLVELIGMEKVLELAIVPVGALENLLGKARVVSLCVDARTGSRRIKAIAKRAAGKDESGGTTLQRGATGVHSALASERSGSG